MDPEALQPETPEGANPEGALRAAQLAVPRAREGRCTGVRLLPEALAPSPSRPGGSLSVPGCSLGRSL